MMLNPSAIVWKNGWRASLARALIITRRELRDSLRDWRIVTPILTLTIVLPSVLIAALRMGHDLLERLGPDALDTKILPFSILAIGFFPMSFSLVIALETFVGEKERNSLEALLSAPLTDRELFTGKFIAAAHPGNIQFAQTGAIFPDFLCNFIDPVFGPQSCVKATPVQLFDH